MYIMFSRGTVQINFSFHSSYSFFYSFMMCNHSAHALYVGVAGQTEDSIDKFRTAFGSTYSRTSMAQTPLGP